MITVGFLFYIFSMFGLAYIVGHSTITKAVREKMYGTHSDIGPIRFARETIVELVECPACLGFWCGVAMAIIGSVPFEVRFNPVAWGLFTAGTNLVLAKLTKII